MIAITNPAVSSGPSLFVRSLGVHVTRLMRIWSREPSSLTMVIIAPLAYLFIRVKLFGALAESLTGHFDANAGVILVVFSWAFILAVTGTGQVYEERLHGFHDRLQTMPSRYVVVLLARAIAEFLRIFVMCIVVTAVADLFTSSSVFADAPLRAVLVFVLVSLAGGTFGTHVGFSITSPQGSVVFMPLIMVMMFSNTALLPASMYRSGLAAIARNAPITAASQALAGDAILPIVLWCGGIIVVCLAGLVVLSRRRQQGVMGA